MEMETHQCNFCEGLAEKVCATCWDQICAECDHDEGHIVLLTHNCHHNVLTVKRADLIPHFNPSLIECDPQAELGDYVLHLEPIPWVQDLDDARRLGRPRCDTCSNSLKKVAAAEESLIMFCSVQCKGDGIARLLGEGPNDQEGCPHISNVRMGGALKFCIDCQGYLCTGCRLEGHRVDHRVLRTWRGGNSVFVKDIQALVDCVDIQKKKAFPEECVQIFRTLRNECRVCGEEIDLGNEFCSVRCKREDNAGVDA